MIKMNYLKVGASMSLLLAGTSILGASLANNKGVGLFAQETPCSHEGNHYAEVKPTATTSGHREFYACCKCHEAWLENPGGAFVNQEESKMSAVLGDGHVAYLPKLTDTLSVTDENSLKDGSKYGYTSLQLKNDLDLTNHEAYSFDSIDLDGIILDLNGKTITSYNGGVAYDGRNFTIKNGNFVAKDNGSYALFAGNEGYDDASCVIDDVVLTGGINVYTIDATIKSTNGKTVINGTNHYAVWADEYTSTKVTIEGGVFHKGAGNTIDKDPDATFTLKGGTFDNLTEEQKSWVAPGYKTVEDGGKISVVKDENVVFISTVEELTALATDVNGGNSYAGKTIFLTADLDLSSIANWTPIGNSTTPFAGSFDGGNHTIKNLTITDPASEGTGLFGYVSNSSDATSFKNVTLEDVQVTLDTATEGKNVGALIGYALKASKDITIDNVNVTGNSVVSGKSHVGGIVGKIYSASATVKNCTNNATVTCGSMYGGGIVGIASDTAQTIVFDSNTNNGSVSGSVIGGIVGRSGSLDVDIINCLNNGNLNSSNIAGGIIGSGEGTVQLEIDNKSGTSNSATLTGTTKGLLIGYIYKYSSSACEIIIHGSGVEEYADTIDTALIGSFALCTLNLDNIKVRSLSFESSWKQVCIINLSNCIVDEINWNTSSGMYPSSHADDGEYLYLNGNSNSTVTVLNYNQTYAFYTNYYSFKDITTNINNPNSAPLIAVPWFE